MGVKTHQPAAVDAPASGAEEFAWPALAGRLLPASYARAGWRCALPVDAQGRLGLGFNLETGEVVRLSVSLESARHLAETVGEFLRGHELRPEDDAAAAGPSQPLENRGLTRDRTPSPATDFRPLHQQRRFSPSVYAGLRPADGEKAFND